MGSTQDTVISAGTRVFNEHVSTVLKQDLWCGVSRYDGVISCGEGYAFLQRCHKLW